MRWLGNLNSLLAEWDATPCNRVHIVIGQPPRVAQNIGMYDRAIDIGLYVVGGSSLALSLAALLSLLLLP
jgi:hypothetical protein